MRLPWFFPGLALLFGLLLGVFSSPTWAKNPETAKASDSAPLVLGSLTQKEQVSGCGCYIQDLAASKKEGSNSYLFFSPDNADPAWIHLNGKDVQVELKKGPTGMFAKKVGDNIHREYRGNGISLNLDLTATKVCEAHAEGCEYNQYDATLEVKQGKSQTQVQGKGSCGC